MARLLPIINRSFPIDDTTWERMWKRVCELYPEHPLAEEVRGKTLAQVPMPKLPSLSPNMKLEDNLLAIQQFIESFQYNHLGTQFFEVKKGKPLSRLLDTAKEIIREALPIKCLEAVVVAIFLTMGMSEVDRFPISFKSVFGTQQHRHIVLGLHHAGRYGALGLSRRSGLMYKPLVHATLSELIGEYEAAYAEVGHVLLRVRVGCAVDHDPHSAAAVEWRALVVHLPHYTKAEQRRILDRFARSIRAGTLPSEPTILRGMLPKMDASPYQHRSARAARSAVHGAHAERAAAGAFVVQV